MPPMRSAGSHRHVDTHEPSTVVIAPSRAAWYWPGRILTASTRNSRSKYCKGTEDPIKEGPLSADALVRRASAGAEAGVGGGKAFGMADHQQAAGHEQVGQPGQQLLLELA